eukprot:1813600-Pyramimonas_sp.AAC.1
MTSQDTRPGPYSSDFFVESASWWSFLRPRWWRACHSRGRPARQDVIEPQKQEVDSLEDHPRPILRWWWEIRGLDHQHAVLCSAAAASNGSCSDNRAFSRQSRVSPGVNGVPATTSVRDVIHGNGCVRGGSRQANSRNARARRCYDIVRDVLLHCLEKMQTAKSHGPIDLAARGGLSPSGLAL